MLISQKLLEGIQEKKKRLDSLRPFNTLQLQQIKENFIVEYVYHSTSMEGNTLTLNETKLILQESITIGGKSLQEHLDVTNQKEAMLFIEAFVKEKKEITEADILALHRITLKGISDYWAGRYKTSENRVVGSRHKTAPPYKVKNEMQALVHLIKKNSKNYHPVELAALAHHELVRIHPFVDGNGRTARLLNNLILMSRGYVPIIIRTKDRKNYFECLEEAHFENKVPFVAFIGRRVEEAIFHYITALSKTTKKNELLSLATLARETPYSQEYLSLLARKGALPATKIGEIWHTTREEIKKYVDNLYKG